MGADGPKRVGLGVEFVFLRVLLQVAFAESAVGRVELGAEFLGGRSLALDPIPGPEVCASALFSSVAARQSGSAIASRQNATVAAGSRCCTWA
jgi:hypothetical protein